MKFFHNKKYTTIAIYTIIVFTICLSLVMAMIKSTELSAVLTSIFKVFSPIIWGVVLAYLLNPVMCFYERHFKKITERKKSRPKLTRVFSLSATIISTLLVISGFCIIVFPQITNSILSLFGKSSEYFNNITQWINTVLEDNPDIMNFVNKEFETFETYFAGLVSQFEPMLKNFITNLTSGTFSLVIGVKDFLLGFIVMIYLLASKQTFKAQLKKCLYAFVPTKPMNKILTIWHKADVTFSKFISGKALDSFIIGMITFIAMQIMDMPYAVLISFIIGVTNMIPFFGPFIGAIPSALLVLLDNPSKVIMFVIFIIVLQQFDGNILGPKILGESTGLPAFWIIFAILIGGGLFGFIGMLLCVPAFAVIYMLVGEFIDERLKKRNLPVEIDCYAKSPTINNQTEDSGTNPDNIDMETKTTK